MNKKSVSIKRCLMVTLATVLIIIPLSYLYALNMDDLHSNQDNVKYISYTYKSTPQGGLEMQVHFPPGWTKQDKRAAIVFFFGGGWVKGGINQFIPQAEYFANRGIVAARADYRVKNRQGTLADKCVEDGKSAIRWIRAHAKDLGIDPERIVSAGGSAGGHVAACTYVVAGYEADGENPDISSKPNLLVLFNPVLDAVSSTKRINRMGSLTVARDLSPNLHLTKSIPATLLFYGTKDSLSEHGHTFVKRAKELDIEASLYVAEGAGHGFFNKEPWLSATIFLMDQFLIKHGILGGTPTILYPEKTVMRLIE